jgi:hypothetical protein
MAFVLLSWDSEVKMMLRIKAGRPIPSPTQPGRLPPVADFFTTVPFNSPYERNEHLRSFHIVMVSCAEILHVLSLLNPGGNNDA